MVRPLLSCILLLVVLAPAAAANEQAAGDGYVAQVPEGYERVDVKAADDPMLEDVLAALPVSELSTRHTFFKGQQLSPEGVFLVSRWKLTDAMPANPLERIEARLNAYRGQLEGAKISLRRRAVDGYTGVELTAHVPASPTSRKGAQHVHLLVVPGGSFVMTIMLAHPSIDSTPTSDDWEHVVRSLSISAPQEALRRLVVWAGVSVGALLAFLFLIKITRRKPSGRRVDFSRAGESLLAGPSAYEGAAAVGSGAGSTRAHDGLPTFHGGGTSAPTPSSMPAVPASSGPSGGTGLPGLKSTLGNGSWKK